MKVISKVLSRRIKGVLLYLNCSNQTAHVKKKFINESGRVISDILEIGKTLALERFNHCLLLQIPQKIVLGIDFVSWIKTILKNQESCIINGGKTTKYFKLERGAWQGDPISAYLFILILEIVFTFVLKITLRWKT